MKRSSMRLPLCWIGSWVGANPSNACSILISVAEIPRSAHESRVGKPWLHIDWREAGVVMPTETGQTHHRGQGRELIEKALPYQLGAKTSYTLGADGVHC